MPTLLFSPYPNLQGLSWKCSGGHVLVRLPGKRLSCSSERDTYLKWQQSTLTSMALWCFRTFYNMPEDSKSFLAKKSIVLIWHLVFRTGLWNQPSWMQQFCFSSLWGKVSFGFQGSGLPDVNRNGHGRTYGVKRNSALKTTFCWNLWPILWLGTDLPLQGTVSMSITARYWNCWLLVLAPQWTFPT